MIDWAQVINAMELPELVDPSKPAMYIETANGWENARFRHIRVTGFVWEGSPQNPRRASELDSDNPGKAR